MHQSALQKAIKFFGSQRAMAEKIGVSQQSINRWLNGQRGLSLECAAKIAIASQEKISLYELVPQKNWLIRYIHRTPTQPLHIEVEKVQTEHTLNQALDHLDTLIQQLGDGTPIKPIAITTDHQLLFGFGEWIAYQRLKKPIIPTQVINIPELLNPTQALVDITLQYSISERTAIAHELEQHIQQYKQQVRRQSQLQILHTMGGQSIDIKHTRTDDIAASLLQLGGRSNYRALKEIVRSGSWALIDALDHKRVSTHQALQQVTTPSSCPKQGASA